MTAKQTRRVRATLLFVDIKDSTKVLDRLGDEDSLTYFEPALAFIRGAVEHFGGTILGEAGDGLNAVFGMPTAREDHADMACRAALAIQAGARDVAVPALEDLPRLSLRVGLASGWIVAIVDPDNRVKPLDVNGRPVNLAARLESVAEPDMVLVSPETYALTRASFGYSDLGRQSLKGFDEKVTAYRLEEELPDAGQDARAPARPKPETDRHGELRMPAFVGRHDKLETAAAHLAKLTAGEGFYLRVIGEPGVGKSRFLRAVCENERPADAPVTVGHCHMHTQHISYWPFIELLRRLLGLDEGDKPERVAPLVQDRLSRPLSAEEVQALDYLVFMIPEAADQPDSHIEPESLRGYIYRAWKLLLTKLCEERPLVLVVEDMHWSDTASLQLLGHIVSFGAALPLGILVSERPFARPSGLHGAAGVETGGLGRAGSGGEARVPKGEPHATGLPADAACIVLKPFDLVAFRNFLAAWLEIENVDSPLVRQIFEASGGNVFFAEEFVRSLFEKGILQRRRVDGRELLEGEIAAADIPGSVEDVIFARIDALAEDVREVLMSASVIGKQFIYEILRKLSEKDEGVADGVLEGEVSQLEEMDVIRQKTTSPYLEYIFKHALIQESVYNSILSRQRQALHLSVAAAIKEIFVDDLAPWSAILAYHFIKGGDLERAQGYLISAADREDSVAADDEALRHYELALEIAKNQKGDGSQRALHSYIERKLADVKFRQGRHAEAKLQYYEALALYGRSFPRGRFAILGATFAQLLRFALTVARERAGLLRSHRKKDADAEARLKIYEGLGWISSFENDWDFVYISLYAYNTARQIDYLEATVKSTTSVGLAFDNIGFARIGNSFHRASLNSGAGTGERDFRFFAQFGAGLNRFQGGALEEAVASFAEARLGGKAAGDLTVWADSSIIQAHVLYFMGRFTEVEAIMVELKSFSEDSSMAMPLRHAQCVEASLGRSAGRYGRGHEAAALAVQNSLAAQDHIAAAIAYAERLHCLILSEKLNEAVALLPEAVRFFKSQRFTFYTHAILGLAFLRLRLRARHPAAFQLDAEAVRAIEGTLAGLRDNRLVPRYYEQFQPERLRLEGYDAWLRGRREAAAQAWETSSKMAAEQGAGYERALTEALRAKHLGVEFDPALSPEIQPGRRIPKHVLLENAL